MELILIISVSYIMGSIPFGLILTKIFLKKDIRNVGSGNIGATNVLRTGNKKIAISVLLLDFLKCYLPTLFILHIYNLNIASFCGLFSIIGHIFSVWVYFKGGKGIACFFGFFLLDSLSICLGVGFFLTILFDGNFIRSPMGYILSQQPAHHLHLLIDLLLAHSV